MFTHNPNFLFILEETIDLLYRFANCSGLHLIFGLNALLRNIQDQWNSSNAKLLIDYCASRKYNMSWELGNGKCNKMFIDKRCVNLKHM